MVGSTAEHLYICQHNWTTVGDFQAMSSGALLYTNTLLSSRTVPESVGQVYYWTEVGGVP